MRKFIVIAAFGVAALLMVGLWASNRQNIAAGRDGSVPGATTGLGKDSLKND
jgi:FtsZ-interacting cell division protein ZipA